MGNGCHSVNKTAWLCVTSGQWALAVFDISKQQQSHRVRFHIVASNAKNNIKHDSSKFLSWNHCCMWIVKFRRCRASPSSSRTWTTLEIFLYFKNSPTKCHPRSRTVGWVTGTTWARSSRLYSFTNLTSSNFQCNNNQSSKSQVVKFRKEKERDFSFLFDTGQLKRRTPTHSRALFKSRIKSSTTLLKKFNLNIKWRTIR